MPGLIEDYGVIGDTQTAALVGRTVPLTGRACPASTPRRSLRGCSARRSTDSGGWGRSTIPGDGPRRSPAAATGVIRSSWWATSRRRSAMFALVDAALRLEALSPDLAVA